MVKLIEIDILKSLETNQITLAKVDDEVHLLDRDIDDEHYAREREEYYKKNKDE